MSVFKQGKVYRYEFQFMGQRIRESAHTSDKELARSIERKRRTAMEESAGGVKRPKPLLFRKAGKTWLAGNAHWSESYREINKLKLSHLLPVFGNLLISEISNEKISKFQKRRQKSGASNREINMETGVLRMILRKHRLWHLLAPDFQPLPERDDVGRALSLEEANRILEQEPVSFSGPDDLFAHRRPQRRVAQDALEPGGFHPAHDYYWKVQDPRRRWQGDSAQRRGLRDSG